MNLASKLLLAGSKCRTIDKVDIFGDGSGKALYRLDGNANDESGNYHGTETAINYGGGVYERGAVFNGSTSKITTSTILGVTSYSVSVWASTTVNSTSSKTIVDFISPRGSFFAGGNAVDSVGFYDNAYRMFTYTLPINTFIHLVFVASGTSMSLYVNGSLHSTITVAGLAVSGGMNIGVNSAGTGGYWNGSLDQVRFFNRALTGNEVATLYAECAPTSTVDNINPFEDGSLKALYQFNGNATDKTGVYNGTATNVTYGTGKFGQCAVFNGTSSKVTTTSNGFWNMALPRTLSCYIKGSTNGVEMLVSTIGSTNGYIQENPTGSANMQIFSSTNTVIGTATGILNNVWNHLVVVQNSVGTYTYVNGNLTSTGAVDGIVGTTGMYIGGYQGGTQWYNGSIDQLRIFNKALTPMEVASLYNETTPLEEPMHSLVDPFKDGSGKALYRLEGNALDESGNYNGTPTSVTYVSSVLGGRAGFFNSNAWFTTPSFGTIGTVFSYSMWINHTVGTSFRFIINFATGYGLLSSGYGGTSSNLHFYNNATWYNLGYTLTGTKLEHVVITVNGTTLKLYVDNVLKNTVTIGSVSIGGAMTFGKDYASTQYYIQATCDQVRVFNKELTQAEITKLYTNLA